MKRRRLLFINIGQFQIFVRKSVVTALFILAVVFLALSRSEAPAAQKVRDSVTMLLTPVLRAIEYPTHLIYGGYENLTDWIRVYRQNKQLKEEHADFLRLKTKLNALENENKMLRKMLNYTPPADAVFVTAKIIVQEGGGFSHSLIVYLGNNTNIETGSVVLGEDGVIGRLESINGAYARVILLTDINSKIPVMTEKTRQRGILSGDNTEKPKLLFTSSEAHFETGDTLVTSGVAGVFPSGLPVGRIARIQKDLIEVGLTGNFEEPEYVKIVDYGFKNPLLIPKAQGDD